MPSQQPPPLPPRSPRPPATGQAPSPRPPAPGYPPPPELPPRPSAASPRPVGPPPPLPPRPDSYEIRRPNDPNSPLSPPLSTLDAPSSPSNQAGLPFPLPPPPPLGPPPPYTPSGVDAFFSPYHTPYSEPGSSSAHSVSPSPASGATSPTTWTKFPPPPPGPPPQPSPYLAPGTPQYPHTPSRPLSPAGSPATLPISQSPSEPPEHQDAPFGTNHTHHNDFQVPTSSAEKPPAYQPPADILGISPGALGSFYPEKQLVKEGPSNSVLSSGATSSHASASNAEPSATIPKSPSQTSSSIQHPSLEESIQSLHLNQGPPVPPKSPLVSTTQDHSDESNTPASGSSPSHSPSSHQAQRYQAYHPPIRTAPSNPTPQETLYPYSPHGPAISTPRAVTSCIDIPMTFSTDWYWHPEAPEYLICSRCYVDHIYGSRYRAAFQKAQLNDSKPRACRFSKPRVKDYLWPEALATGSLQLVLGLMRKRSAILDCKGADGVKGKFAEGITWYTTPEIPAFLSCQACYEDKLLTNPKFAPHFKVHTETQPADALWACDMPVSYIEREYEEKGKKDDWSGFVAEAKARISERPCPGTKKIPSYGRNWYVPRAGPDGLILCAACYCDHVIHSGEESKWEIAQALTQSRDREVRCARGVFNIRILMAQAYEKKDFGLFWRAVERLRHEKGCEDTGIVDGTWYMLPSNAAGFGVCAACYVAILEPLDVARFWVRKADVPLGAKVLCCFNITHPRLFRFVPRLLEMYFTLDPKALDEYASVYAAIPVCLRDEDKPGRRWYGWQDCTICPECYLDFARHSPLEKLMGLRDAQVAESRMCEMYSPRMRKLYTECGSKNPPDLEPLLEYSVERRQIYAETIPKIRTILSQQRMALHQQKFLNTMSSHHMVAGQLDQITYGMPYTYSAPGIGAGFANLNALQGAAYAQQATGVATGIGNGSHMMAVQQLEKRWRAVE
ncbi:hypothetical protein F4678DRAFT_202179 [Xylaria arbuscula]|nr:hypothetical protein F4678DRAFT_202179 [Xylaria arbuscula]